MGLVVGGCLLRGEGGMEGGWGALPLSHGDGQGRMGLGEGLKEVVESSRVDAIRRWERKVTGIRKET
jgi:hypothetical protein